MQEGEARAARFRGEGSGAMVRASVLVQARPNDLSKLGGGIGVACGRGRFPGEQRAQGARAGPGSRGGSRSGCARRGLGCFDRRPRPSRSTAAFRTRVQSELACRAPLPHTSWQGRTRWASELAPAVKATLQQARGFTAPCAANRRILGIF